MDMSQVAAEIVYRNEPRQIIPTEVWFGSTEQHPEPQWLLTAFDLSVDAQRDFALKDFGRSVKQEVKPLEWACGFAATPFGIYETGYLEGGWGLYFADTLIGIFATEAGAKAAAQPNYASRILAALV